jgi:dipeptidyl-peptidase 4
MFLQKLTAIFLFVCFILFYGKAQQSPQRWSKDGSVLYQFEKGVLIKNELTDNKKTDILTPPQLTPTGKTAPLNIRDFQFSDDASKILIFTNSQRVWRFDTRGDYWVYDFNKKNLTQIGRDRPAATLMFAKFSPDGMMVAYVSDRNIYVEDLATGKAKALTSTNGTKKLINGTFDWVYEEEFNCRDGFRWSPDSKNIAYWQIDANQIKDHYMINTTDAIYPKLIPVEYPKVGEQPSPCRVGVVNVKKGKTTWMKVEGDPANNYIPRMDWAANANELILLQLNRKQTHAKIIIADAKNGAPKTIWEEKDNVWIDVPDGAGVSFDVAKWQWLSDNNSFLWQSEKDGWQHIYRIDRAGKETLLTKGAYDAIALRGVDERNGLVYFMASPTNATQRYLYRVKLDGSSQSPELVSDPKQDGWHTYNFSPNGQFATHSFTNRETPRVTEWLTMPNHKPLTEGGSIATRLKSVKLRKNPPQFFQVTTADGITMDGWWVKPTNFDSTKKYPILFEVYSEPAATTVNDNMGAGGDALYNGSLADDGYIYMSLDGRGTPAPKGKAWRKAIYRKIGIVNIRDQAMAAREILKWQFVDTSRVAVWGWSGGGSATLNLLFQYPDIYKTGISVAAVANQLTYDNIYQERYMGIPQENKEDFIAGSPMTHAKNLRGNLLYIHGTGDDNVHYQNAEMLINELVKHNKLFQVMPYPNRSHGIFEGEGTGEHLQSLFTQFLKTHCPPGGRL